jgi:hypothetical protein
MGKSVKKIQDGRLNEGARADNEETIGAGGVPAVKARFRKSYIGDLGVYHKNNVYEIPYHLWKLFLKSGDIEG